MADFIENNGPDGQFSAESPFIVTDCSNFIQSHEALDLSSLEGFQSFAPQIMKNLESTKTGIAVSSLIQSHCVITQLLIFQNKSLGDWLKSNDSLSSVGNNLLYYIATLYCLQSIKRFTLNRLGIFTASPFGFSSWKSLYGETDPDINLQLLIDSKQLDQYLRKCKSRGKSPQASVILNHYINDKLSKNFSELCIGDSLSTNHIETRQIATLAKVCVGIISHSKIANNNKEYNVAVLNLFNYLCYILQFKVPGKVEQNFSLEELEMLHRSKTKTELLFPSRRTWNDFFRKNSHNLPKHFNTKIFESYATIDGDDMIALRLDIYLIMAEIYIYQSLFGDLLSPTSGWLADDGYSSDSEYYAISNILRVMAINSPGGNLQRVLNTFLLSTGLSKHLDLWNECGAYFKTFE